MDKIHEAQEILKDMGMPEAQQNKISALTLLALSNIKPEDDWKSATSKSMTLTKDIMEFVNNYYDAGYKPNTRESFRKIALKPFVENNIAILNPDDNTLSPTSSKTHYSISPLALEVIKDYFSDNKEIVLNKFKKNQYVENIPTNIILKKLSIKNYKSIQDISVDLGRFNVFIGVNGCGKTNILEALATVGASTVNDLNFEGLYSRGVRIARPDLTFSSFLKSPKIEKIDISMNFEKDGLSKEFNSLLYPEDPKDLYTKWRDVMEDELTDRIAENFTKALENIVKSNKQSKSSYSEELNAWLNETRKKLKNNDFQNILSEYVIYDLNTKSLRGVIPSDSRKTPLGINGEGLDLLIANFNSYEREHLEKCKIFFDWLDTIYNDKGEKAKAEGLNPGRSTSTLYFTDKFMQKQNNTFSAENSNEGILHVLFYVSLFISTKTPNLFAIDNIETALNPRLCQALIKELSSLAKSRGKQALITTHNPAVLDGLNLLDDDQRLFEVYRDSEGKTQVRRIKFKSDLSDKKFKLSEMWLKGLLGAIPTNF
jgi:predicted ATPase